MKPARNAVRSSRGTEVDNVSSEKRPSLAENVDSTNERQFFRQMAEHTLSEVNTPTSSHEVMSNDRVLSQNQSIDGRGQRMASGTNDGGHLWQRVEHSLPSTGSGHCKTRQKPFDQDSYDDSDSQPDSFDLEMENKRCKFRQNEALESLQAWKWMDAEASIQQILTESSKEESYDFTFDDWRVYLSTAQVAQHKLSEGLATLRGVDTKNLAKASIGRLQFLVAMQACGDSDSILAEKYCLRAMKSYRKADNDTGRLLATELLSHIFVKKGDSAQSKFYKSLLPLDWQFAFTDLDNCVQSLHEPHVTWESYIGPIIPLSSKTPKSPNPHKHQTEEQTGKMREVFGTGDQYSSLEDHMAEYPDHQGAIDDSHSKVLRKEEEGYINLATCTLDVNPYLHSGDIVQSRQLKKQGPDTDQGEQCPSPRGPNNQEKVFDFATKTYIMPEEMIARKYIGNATAKPLKGGIAMKLMKLGGKRIVVKEKVLFTEKVRAQLSKHNLQVVRGKVRGTSSNQFHRAFKAAFKDDDVDLARALVTNIRLLNYLGVNADNYVLGIAAYSCKSTAIPLTLLENGFGVNLRDSHGSTALHDAASRDERSTNEDAKHDICELLLKKGANVHFEDEDGVTPLMQAAQGGHETVKLLLEHNANIESVDKRGRTALSWATFVNGDANVVELLLNKGANVNHPDSNGQTPLILMIRSQSQAKLIAVTYLLAHGANCHWKDDFGCTALVYAKVSSLKREPELTDLLISYGAKT